jgi:hypothetical protein
VQATPVSTLSITTRTLPAGHVGRPYTARLGVSGGTKPVTWSRKGGSLPPGVRLLPGGRLTGTPRAAGRFTPVLRASDANGGSVSRRLAIVVRAA